MSAEANTSLNLFYCYAPEDKHFCDDLDHHLSNLKRKYNIKSWSDHEISAGAEWEKESDTQLKSAQLILLLISANFMANEYCYSIQMKQALEHHEAGKARVIPIILRPVDWKDAPFHDIPVLPSDKKPITQWQDRDAALWDIVQGIRIAIEELPGSPKAQQKWVQKRVEEGNTFYKQNRYEEALAAYEEAITSNPNEAAAYNNKGAALEALNRYEEAITAYKEAIRLNPNDTTAYNNMGTVLEALNRRKEAITIYEQAIRLNPSDMTAYLYKGSALMAQKQDKEALATYDDLERTRKLNNPAYSPDPRNNITLTLHLIEAKRMLGKRKPKLA